jgi:hypothetical protein
MDLQSQGLWPVGRSRLLHRPASGRASRPMGGPSPARGLVPEQPTPFKKRSPSFPPQPSAALPSTDFARNYQSSSFFRLGGNAISQLATKKTYKNNGTIFRLPKGQTEKREKLELGLDRKPARAEVRSQSIPAGNPANTGVVGNKKPRPRTEGASCLVVRQGLELWTEGSEVLSARTESFAPKAELAHRRVTA